MDIKRTAFGLFAAGVLTLGLVPGAMAAETETTNVTVTLTEAATCSISDLAADGEEDSFGGYTLTDRESITFTGPSDPADRTVTLNGTVDSVGQVTGNPVEGGTCNLSVEAGSFWHQSTLTPPQQYGYYFWPLDVNERIISITSGGALGYLSGTPGKKVTVTDGAFSLDLTLAQTGKVIIDSRLGTLTNPSDEQLADLMGDYSAEIRFTASPEME